MLTSERPGARTMNSLVGTLPSGARFHHRLDRDRFTIGRSSRSSIRLAAASVSNLHAELIAKGRGRYIVRDLGSTNGTFVNGEPVSETEVAVPCKLMFGTLECELLAPDPASPKNGEVEMAVEAKPPAQKQRAVPVRPKNPLPQVAAGCAIGIALGFLIAKAPSPFPQKPPKPAPIAAPSPPPRAEVFTPLVQAARFDFFGDEKWKAIPGAPEAEEPPPPPPAPTPAPAPPTPIAIQAAESFSAELIALTKAARAGEPRALGITAVLLAEGVLPPPDANAALDSAQSSAAQTSPFGDFALARFYMEGKSTPKDETRARQLGLQAFKGLQAYASSGDGWAEEFLGELLEAGIGVAPDAEQAEAHYRKAAELGNRLAVAHVARFLIPKDLLSTPLRPLADDLRMVILGDSMSLCGFGKRLDQRFRERTEVKSVNTYMACGTNPLSWLQEKPFGNIRTHCGFWTINSVTGATRPLEFQDTYGSSRGHLPGSYPVPRLEALVSTIKPNVLVMQCGTNLFSLFRGRKTVQPSRDASMLRSYLAPFMAHALKPSSSVRKIYWVGSPTSGRVSMEIQDFVFAQIRSYASRSMTVIDSRPLVPYPYRRMEPDREHFFGPEMTQWADKVFALIERDLSLQPLAKENAPEVTSGAQDLTVPAVSETLRVTAKLILKTPPIPLKELLPYQESLVGYVYEVTQVLEGKYEQKEVLVMHPAHIALKRQSLDRYKLGGTYELKLHDLEKTLWRTVKCQDDSGKIDLVPQIQVEDEARFPENL